VRANRVDGQKEVARVPYAFVQDIAASWQHYQQVAAILLEPTPPGLVLHAAGPTDEGIRIIGVWASKEAWQEFQAESLAPVIAALRGPALPEPTFRELRPLHMVLGGHALERIFEEEVAQ
jgi:hypothetical protein